MTPRRAGIVPSVSAAATSGSGAEHDAPGPEPRRGTVARVVVAATHLLADSPEATMQEIAEAAGLGRATIYRHFASREELLDAITLAACQEMRALLDGLALDEGDVVEALRRALEAFFAVGDRYRFLAERPEEHSRALDKDAAVREIFAPVAALLDRARREGVIREEVSTEWVRGVLGALIHTAFEMVAAGDLARADAPALVLRTVLNGIAAPGVSAGRGAPS
jgi:TetR/AcrR family transcriptional regulator, mexCD-oprJ operon repressor